MSILVVIGALVVVGGLIGFVLVKRTAANESNSSYRRASFTRE